MRRAQEPPAGPGTLSGTAKPDRLWSDGASTAVLRFEAKLADGRPAIQIVCGMPQGCETRALAMCNQKYDVLDMKNMPTRGDASVVRGTGTVVVRCS